MISEKAFVCKTWKTKAAATVAALIVAVALPQFFHVLGVATGIGSKIGEVLLPMHIAVFVAGFCAGPWAGLTTGALAPMLSYALTGMPAAAVLPFMAIELSGYGIASGLTADAPVSPFYKLLGAQIFGRALRAAAVLVAVYGFGAGVPVASIWQSAVTGLPGIALQWAIVPLVTFWLARKQNRDA